LADVFGQLPAGNLNLALGLGPPIPPRTSVRLVQLQFAELRRIRPYDPQVGWCNKGGIIAGEYEPDHLPRGPTAHRDRLQAIQHGESPLQMDDDCPLRRHIRVLECPTPGPRERLRMMSPAAENIGSGDNNSLPDRQGKTCIEVR
jgi:hypothetical protein